jgi:hypothetical protein
VIATRSLLAFRKLAMSDFSSLFSIFLTAVAYNLPMAIISLTGIVLILRRQSQICRRHKNFALLGFSLNLALAIVRPIIHITQQLWFFHSPNAATFGLISWVTGSIFTVLHALGYLCLLIALLPPKPKPPEL